MSQKKSLFAIEKTNIKTFMCHGLKGHEISIEVDTNRSLPYIEIIGLGDIAVKESKERIRSTLRNCNIELPRRKIILNLAPSDIKKGGTSFDLPMAVAIFLMLLEYPGEIVDFVKETLFFGELGLDGDIKRVNGLLPAVISAYKKGRRQFVIPYENLEELSYLPDLIIYPIKNFNEIKKWRSDGEILYPNTGQKSRNDIFYQDVNFVDFSAVRGQSLAKRALSIAAAGFHNIILSGPPGSGKTMLARALASIMPPLNFTESIEVSQIYSILGKLNRELPMIVNRPFRQIHHTASKIAIVGGGQQLLPGEISLANKGILYFDELTEFPRELLDVLRQPLEDRFITISRVTGTLEYPAHFMFVGSMNPCKCGFYGDGVGKCRCSHNEIKNYQSKLSGPLLDRIDMLIDVKKENLTTILEEKSEEDSKSIKEKVIKARRIQQKRFEGTNLTGNSHITAQNIKKYIKLGKDEEAFLQSIGNNYGYSARLIHRLMKISRTIADLDGEEHIKRNHIAEAFQYRSTNMLSQ